MSRYYIILQTVLILFPFNILNAQNSLVNNVKVGIDYQLGLQLAEYSFINKESKNLLQSFDIVLSKESKGKDVFEQIFNFPEKGLAIHFSSLGNSKVFGNGYGLNYFFLVNLIDKKQFRITNRMGLGLAYITKKHDFDSNPMNLAIGSNLNIYFNCRFGAHFSISEKWEINTGLSFDHYSNANTASPNIGLNNLFATAGIVHPVTKETERSANIYLPIKNKFNLELIQSFGSKHSQSYLSKYFLTSSFSIQSSYKWYTGFHVGAGIDLFYDSSVKYILQNSNQNFRESNLFQTGFHVSQTVAYRKFRFTLQEGIYTGLTNKLNNKSIYNRGLLSYNINDKYSMRLAMKSHLHILDYPEIGVGFKLL